MLQREFISPHDGSTRIAAGDKQIRRVLDGTSRGRGLDSRHIRGSVSDSHRGRGIWEAVAGADLTIVAGKPETKICTRFFGEGMH